MPFNWFDLLVAMTLIAGVSLGRRKGFSEELLPLFQWLAIIVVGALYYEPLGHFAASYANISLLMGYVSTYLFIALMHKLLFDACKRLIGEKLVSGDIFGGMEYYLGAAAGGLRFACILLFLMALLNARLISREEMAATARMQRENFGAISFPTIGLVQKAIFLDSATGRFVKQYLNDQLIVSTPADQRAFPRQELGRLERAVNGIWSL